MQAATARLRQGLAALSFVCLALLPAHAEGDRDILDEFDSPGREAARQSSDAKRGLEDRDPAPSGFHAIARAGDAEDGVAPPDGDDKDILDGFDSPRPEPASAKPSQEEPALEVAPTVSFFRAVASDWEVDGRVTVGSSFAFAQSGPEPGRADYRGLTRLRSQLDLAVEIPLPGSARMRVSGHGFRDFAYAIKGRSEYTSEVLDLYESEVELDELWVAFSPFANLDVKVGRQIATLGPADMLRVVDVLNPIDNREPGLIDLEDLRLPVAMTRVDGFLGPVRATAVAVHESRSDKIPVFGSDFYPPDLPALPEDRPANGGKDTEYAFVLAMPLGRTDTALYHERYFEKRGRPSRSGLLEPARLTLTGVSAARPFGAWLLKGEFAMIEGFEFVRSNKRMSRSDALLGIEYSGFSETQIGLEVAMRHLNGFDSDLEFPPDTLEKNAWEWAVRYRREFMDNTCRFSLFAFGFGSRLQNGSGARAMLLYNATDSVSFEIGVLAFRRGERRPFTFIKNNDRFFGKMQYRF